LKLKTEESIYDCFLWSDGEFKFLDDQLPNEIAVLVAENLTSIVLEGARRADEWRRIREVFPSLQITFKVNEDAAASAAVPEEDRRVLCLVRKGLTIAEIALEMHAVKFYAASRLWNLHQQGLIRIDRIWQEIPLEQQVQETSDLLRQGATAFKAGRLAEARAAFQKALCKDPQDKYAHLLLIKVRQMMKCAEKVEVFSRDSVLALKAPAPPVESLNLDPKAFYVLSRINGKWDVDSITKLCPMTESEVLDRLRHLLDCSLVEVKSVNEAAPPSVPASSADSLGTAGEPA
jgi:tetratricopeptide (TPR) repeat protein